MGDRSKKLIVLLVVFLAAYFIPFQSERVKGAVFESLMMLQEYAREHVILCLIPAILIAGGIAVFISQASVIKYFGAKANKFLAYSVASVSGTILAVCSCTVLPLFGGIYYRGAGLGPATAFLYSGPAINVLAIVLTARILGWKMGLARALAAVSMSVMIGLLMHFIFIKEERARVAPADDLVPDDGSGRALWKNTLFFFSLVGVLVFANWGKPAGMIIETSDGKTVSGTRVLLDEQRIVLKVDSGGEIGVPRDRIANISYAENLYSAIYNIRFFIAGAFLLLLIVILFLWFDRNDMKEWGKASWDLGMQIVPLLFIGVVIAGLALGRPGKEALIPSQWIAALVGGNSLLANLFASVSGGLMYFATLTEVPILQGLMGSGMGKGPALALLLSGPAVSLPSMLVLRQVMGTKKMLVYVSLVIVFSAIAGFLYGYF